MTIDMNTIFESQMDMFSNTERPRVSHWTDEREWEQIGNIFSKIYDVKLDGYVTRVRLSCYLNEIFSREDKYIDVQLNYYDKVHGWLWAMDVEFERGSGDIDWSKFGDKVSWAYLDMPGDMVENIITSTKDIFRREGWEDEYTI